LLNWQERGLMRRESAGENADVRPNRSTSEKVVIPGSTVPARADAPRPRPIDREYAGPLDVEGRDCAVRDPAGNLVHIQEQR
jgi:hypothetical protein